MTEKDAKQPRNAKTGLPTIDSGEASSNQVKTIIVSLIFNVIFLGIGYGIVYLIYSNGSTSLYDSRIDKVKAYHGQYFMAYLILFELTVLWLNLYPMVFKAAIMRRDDGNLRANMFIYKLATDKSDEKSAIVLHEDGDIGNYNRANRSIYHFLENSLPFVASLPLTFFMFPFPTFVLTCMFCLGRIVYQIGYTSKGYGGHVIGFMLDRISTYTLTALLLFTFIKTYDPALFA